MQYWVLDMQCAMFEWTENPQYNDCLMEFTCVLYQGIDRAHLELLVMVYIDKLKRGVTHLVR